MPPLAARTARITSSPTMKVTATVDELRRRGIEVLDFGAGEPDFPTPDRVKAAGRDALDHDFTRYTPAAGIVELKRAIADRYRADYGVDYKESEIIVTAGGKQALFNAALALFGPGDEVITHAPYWPSLTEQVKLADATPVLVRTHPEDGFAVHAEALLAAVTPRTRGIIVNSPCNPTGALVSEDALAAIADRAARQGIWIVVDLCYERLIYDVVPHNVPRVLGERCRELTVLCGSASKAYSMTGWRCGWALGPAPVIAAAGAIQSHSTSNVSSITQKAAVEALSGSQAPVREMLEEYRQRRDNLHAWLTAEPRLQCRKPAGAFYLFVDVGQFLSVDGLRTSNDFAQALLDDARVAVTPGEAFDAPGFIRISYATSMEILREGTARLLDFVTRIGRQTSQVGERGQGGQAGHVSHVGRVGHVGHTGRVG
jgi:aspartate aminotransferase